MIPTSGLYIETEYDDDVEYYVVRNVYGDALSFFYTFEDAQEFIDAP